ncbi:MAG: PCRF domain-containing protein, partial [Candidatus Saccharimonadales bacterium]
MDKREEEFRQELRELEIKLADPAIFSDSSYPVLAKRLKWLSEVISLFEQRALISKSISEASALLNNTDRDLGEMANQEIAELTPKLGIIEAQIADATLPKDPNDQRDVIIEIRAAAGGDESSLFG